MSIQVTSMLTGVAQMVGQQVFLIDRLRWATSQESMEPIAESFLTVVKKYPPETVSNKPRPGRFWYKRGVGLYDPRGRLIKRSEQLGQNWRIDYIKSMNSITALIKNPVSYTEDVQGINQREVFRLIGWPNVGQARESASNKLAETYGSLFKR